MKIKDEKNRSNRTKTPTDEKKFFQKLENYTIELYKEDVQTIGLETTWQYICAFALKYGETEHGISVKNFGEMYEIGLDLIDKNNKKKRGQYYTPSDVALVLCKWLFKTDGENICDVACGTGNLILTYLEFLGKEQALKILKNGQVYLYDNDALALKICKTSILVRYGIELENKIHILCGDFLEEEISLPNNCKTIANPPYASIKKYEPNWKLTDVLEDAREWYAAFMEKICSQSTSAVIITPFSFVSGNKFYSLRKKMCAIGYGDIVIFDNVPGNIFCGKKKGIFNSNTANSVRAAITIFNSSKEKKGYRISPMIRFKTEERELILNCKVLESTLNSHRQVINKQNPSFKKIDKVLENVYKKWVSKSHLKVKDLLSKKENIYLLDIPNTCRYNTTASSKKLVRKGSITLYAQTKDYFAILYCFMNSSFAYWWWRIYDGGITYPVNLLYEMPIPINLMNNEDMHFFKTMAKEMIAQERNFLATKVNSGSLQENIKFPEQYRNQINERILKLLGCEESWEIFRKIHANFFFEKEK